MKNVQATWRIVLVASLKFGVLLGLVALVFQRFQLASLRVEYDRLSSKFGKLDGSKSQGFAIVRIDTKEPMHFCWRMATPPIPASKASKTSPRLPVLQLRSSCRKGQTTLHNFANPTQAGKSLYRCRLEFVGDDLFMNGWTSNGFSSSSSRTSLNGDQSRFLKKHWAELEVTILSENFETVTVPVDGIVNFLSIRIPPSLEDELIEEIGEDQARVLMESNVIEMSVGLHEAFEAREKERGRVR